MIRRASRRDANEAAIVAALEACGATVQPLNGDGLPDLLVGWHGVNALVEVKDPKKGARNSRSTGAKVSNPLGVRDSQYAWMLSWKGAAVHVVTTIDEALAVIGVKPDGQGLSGEVARVRG